MFMQTSSNASILFSDCHKLDLFGSALQHTTLTVLLSFIVCLKLHRWRSRQELQIQRSAKTVCVLLKQVSSI